VQNFKSLHLIVSREPNNFSKFHPKLEPRFHKKKKSIIIQIYIYTTTHYLDHRVHKNHTHLKTIKENVKKTHDHIYKKIQDLKERKGKEKQKELKIKLP
jgi:hypothetical protein